MFIVIYYYGIVCLVVVLTILAERVKYIIRLYYVISKTLLYNSTISWQLGNLATVVYIKAMNNKMQEWGLHGLATVILQN